MNKKINKFNLTKFLLHLCNPILILIVLITLIKDRQSLKRFSERIGIPGRARPEKDLIWIHGASIGEINSIKPIIKYILDRYQDTHILITTDTMGSAQMIEQYKKQLNTKKIIHQFLPVANFNCDSFINFWSPKMIIWLESEFFPYILWSIKKSKIPCHLINARISNRSFKKWTNMMKILPSMINMVFSTFTEVLTQNNDTLNYLHKLGVKRARHIGNLKYIVKTENNNQYQDFVSTINIKNRFVLLAASTFLGEEKIISNCHQKLKPKYPNLLTIIVPRQIEFIDKIKQNIKKINVNIARRSCQDKINDKTDIYLVDTYGELTSFYSIADIAFIGKSLIGKGGQNPIEAMPYNCAIIFGPHMDNFKEICANMLTKQAAVEVQKTELCDYIETLIIDKNKRKKLSNNANKLITDEEQKNILYIKKIQNIIKANMMTKI